MLQYTIRWSTINLVVPFATFSKILVPRIVLLEAVLQML